MTHPDSQVFVSTADVEVQDVLAASWLLGDLTSAEVRSLAAECTTVRVEGGRPLFRQGDAGDAMYLVAHGRLQVLREDRGEIRRLTLLYPGDHVGEYALLADTPRSATVAAVRDSVVVRIARDTFARFVAGNAGPSLRLATRIVEHHTQRNRPPPQPIRVIGLFPTAAHPDFDEAVWRLEAALQEYGEVARLNPSAGLQRGVRVSLAETGARLTRALDRLEREHRFVLAVCDPEATPWTQEVLRQADVVVLAGLGDDPTPSPAERELMAQRSEVATSRVELLRLRPRHEPTPRGTLAWLTPRKPHLHAHHHAQLGTSAGFQRLVRVVTGRAIGLALGGGGVRGYAHLGVFRALAEAGIAVDAISGASAGAYMGVMLAAGWDDQTILRHVAAFEKTGVLDLTLPRHALTKGQRLMRNLSAIFGDLQLEDLPIPCLCVASDLVDARVVTLEQGSAALALRASTSIPALYPPVVVDGKLLVDGGLLNNLPADVLHARLPGCRVIAVDVGQAFDTQALAGPVAGKRSPLRRWLRPDDDPPLPRFLDVLVRASTLGSARHLADTLRDHVDHYIAPPVSTFGTFETGRAEQIVRAGYDCVAPQLDALRSACLERRLATANLPALRPSSHREP